MSTMTICSFTLVTSVLAGLLIFALRKPSKEEIKKFKSKAQDRLNWSNMGF